MPRWELIDRTPIPSSKDSLSLYQNKDDFLIKLTDTGTELMHTRQHGSEDALGRLPCETLKNTAEAKVLIGGLGMGFTLASALQNVGPAAEVTVVELLPKVVEWNTGPLGERSGHPLRDDRTHVHVGDVTKHLREKTSYYDAIALDIDNGPEGLTIATNDWLYSSAGIGRTREALRPGGVVAYWSSDPDRSFAKRLVQHRYHVSEETVFAHGTKGARHTIWLAQVV